MTSAAWDPKIVEKLGQLRKAPGTSALAYSIGFVVATGGLHGVGIAIGLLHGRPAGRRIVRLAGAAVAAAGGFFLWRAIAG